MTINKFAYDPISAWTYILGEAGQPCLVFDLGSNPKHALERYVESHHGGKVLGLFLTHGHFDHFAGLNDLDPAFECPLYVPALDEVCLFDSHRNGSFELGLGSIELEEKRPYELLSGGEHLKLGPYEIEVIHTPFHTQGSLCYYLKNEKILISGDTLFHLSVGRGDLRHSVPSKMNGSLKKLLDLPDETKVYPGHGPSSTLGQEKLYNPFLRISH